MKENMTKNHNARNITYREAIREAISQAMMSDSRVFIMGEDVGVYQGVNQVTGDLLATFGEERVLDTPISESAFMGAAVGAAMLGRKPIVELQVVDFISVCFDSLINQAAKIRYMSGGQFAVPLVVRAAYGGGLGAAAQHSQSLEAFFAHIPGLKVLIPATPYDAKGLLLSAINDPNPVVFLEPRSLYNQTGMVPKDPYTIEIGRASVKRTGSDLTLISYGQSLAVCQAVADALASEFRLDIEVLDLRSIQPLDRESILQSVKKTKRALIVHEAVEFAGFGAEVSSLISGSELFHDLLGPVQRIGAKFCPLPFSKVMEQAILPGFADIRQRILEMFGITG